MIPCRSRKFSLAGQTYLIKEVFLRTIMKSNIACRTVGACMIFVENTYLCGVIEETVCGPHRYGGTRFLKGSQITDVMHKGVKI